MIAVLTYDQVIVGTVKISSKNGYKTLTSNTILQKKFKRFKEKVLKMLAYSAVLPFDFHGCLKISLKDF